MVGSSKILTVSYGTFSCTLEGFDDSFSTMKAIAEYFRDLAADDRYFGAEPATPDAELLARIAERQVTQRVEARTNDAGIVLTAGAARAADHAAEDAAEAATADVQDTPTEAFVSEDLSETDLAEDATAEAPTMPPVAEAPARPAPAMYQAPEVEKPDFAAPEVDLASAEAEVEEPEAPQTDLAGADSVAAKLQRIRAVVGHTAPVETAPQEDSSLFADQADDTPADDDNIMGEAAVAEDFAEAFAATEETADTEPTDTVADSVSQALADAADIGEEEADDAFELADELEAEAEDAAADELAAELADVDMDDEPAAEPQAEETAAEIAEETAAEIAETTDEPAPVRARVIRMRRSEVAESAAVETDGATDNDLAEAADALAEAAELDEMTEATATEDGDALTDQVFEDLGMATDDPTLEEVAELAQLDGAEAADVALDEASSLSDDAEADLQAELASLMDTGAEADDPFAADEGAGDAMADLDTPEMEVAVHDTAEDTTADEVEDLAEVAADEAATEEAAEDTTETDSRPESTSRRPRRVRMPGSVGEDDVALTRIMTETEAKMLAPDSSRRREAIAQLKAAVAATEAERDGATEDDAPEDADAQFRDDLRQVVRPTRPIRPSRPSRPNEQVAERPASAPLKLVASQRVDVEDQAETEAADPVRPRRVSSAPIEPSRPTAAGEGFTGFVDSMGVEQLDDLLEAAAAYTSFVEGAEDFSRPQLMAKVKEHAGEAYSREDGLRAFGTLLRQGRITKVRKGRFQVTDDTRFNPARRAS